MSAPYAVSSGSIPSLARRVPFEEYLAAEQRAETRSEYLDGVVRAMAGVKPRHVFVEVKLGEIMPRLLGDGCIFLNASVHLWLASQRIYTYPDGAIAGPP